MGNRIQFTATIISKVERVSPTGPYVNLKLSTDHLVLVGAKMAEHFLDKAKIQLQGIAPISNDFPEMINMFIDLKIPFVFNYRITKKEHAESMNFVDVQIANTELE